MQKQESYFSKLGEALGMDIRPGDDGTCYVTVDGAMPVAVRANGEAQRMEVTAAVADELPEGIAYSDMLDLLDAAIGPLFDAPGIGREPESGVVILYALMPFATMTPEDFAEAVPQFIDLASAFSGRLARLAQPD